MATRVTLDVGAKPGTGDGLVALFRSILQDARSHEGCKGIDALQDSDDADHVVPVEVWETREQYEKYRAWQRERGATAQLLEALAEPPIIRPFDVTDA